MDKVRSVLSRMFGKAQPGRHAVDNRRFLLEMMPKGACCLEIGTWKGDFSAQIIEVTRPAQLHLVDPWKCEEGSVYEEAWYGEKKSGGQAAMDAIYQGVCERFREEINAGVVHVHREYSDRACSAFEDGFFDWIYIDGNHLYEFVKADLENYFPKVRPGGFISGDDYLEGGWWKGGVKKAVDEFVASGCCEPVVFRNQQFILRKN